MGALATGSLVTLIVKWIIDRRARRRGERRGLYLDLLALMNSQRRGTERLSWEGRGGRLPSMPDEKLDDFNARLEVDSSARVRELALRCFRSRLKFWNSYSMWAPIEVDEHGFFHYRFDIMRRNVVNEDDEGDNEGQRMVMRVALGQLHDEFTRDVDALAAQIRRELHGRSAD